MPDLTVIAPLAGLLSLIIVVFIYLYIKRQPSGSLLMQEIEGMIHEGAMTFLKREYAALFIFVVLIVPLLRFYFKEWYTPAAFVSGCLSSILAVYTGVKAATRGNSRTAEAADKSGQIRALFISRYSGSVMGISVAGFGILGLGAWFWKMGGGTEVAGYLVSFAMGASSVALFVRIGGGIFSKAADLGSDLAARIEAGISLDNPRNPGVIADNVGDNAGDIAGMGADLYESYVAAIIASMALGAVVTIDPGFLEKFPILKDRDPGAVSVLCMGLPLLFAVAGQVSSLIGIFSIKAFGSRRSAGALRSTMFISDILFAMLAAAVIGLTEMPWGFLWAVFSGVICGLVLGLLSEYSTSGPPSSRISEQIRTGPASVIITGLAEGMRSTSLPVISICAAACTGYYFAGIYGLGITAVGIIATAGAAVTIGAYGSITDNAGRIAVMSGLGESTQRITKSLDTIGNTTASMGKGFASGSAALTAIALFAAYTEIVGLHIIDMTNPLVVAGVFIGAVISMYAASGVMTSVGRAALKIVEEVRRQLREVPGLLGGKEGVMPDLKACISIAAGASIMESIIPVLTAIICPIAAGVLLGPEFLGGMILGVMVMGVFLSIFMSNAGGAWDTARRYIESGNFGGKDSENHRAAAVGGMVGDPFKDASGPAMNTMIKVVGIVSLLIAPFIKSGGLFFGV